MLGTYLRLSRRAAPNGPFNIQFMARDNDVMVIECNARLEPARFRFAHLGRKTSRSKPRATTA